MGRASESIVGPIQLWASMMCARLGQLDAEVLRLEDAGADGLHVDMMDGHFVPNLGIGMDLLRAIASATQLPVSVHAMVDEPERFVEAVAAAGADRYIFHFEVAWHPALLIEQIRASGMTAGLGLNPTTTPAVLDGLPSVDELLVMTVEPGFASGSWISDSPERTRSVRAARPRTPIIVDGHIDVDTAPVLLAAGATDFVCGSSALFFPGSNYAMSLRALRNRLVASQSTSANQSADKAP